jgi:hypothetical protein
MADANIKKVTIKRSSLPPVDHDSQKYNIRYRIISEDKNRNSHWSSIYNSDGGAVIGTSGALSITPEIITAVWGDENFNPSYDIFVSFDGNPFFHHGISAVHSYPFLNTGTTSVRVKIQIVSSKKQIKEALLVYDSGVRSL